MRSLAQTLDSLLKEMVGISYYNDEHPEMLLPKICDKMSGKDPRLKIFLVGWITFLSSIPEIDILNELPNFLSSLFSMLYETNR